MLKVKDVIEKLQQLPSESPVYVVADHGQTLIQCGHVDIDHVEELSYYAEQAWADDGERRDLMAPEIVLIGD